MKSDSPLSRKSFHPKPGVISVIVLIKDINPISFAHYWLIVRPATSRLNMILCLEKWNISPGIEILSAQIKWLEKWMNWVIFITLRILFNHLFKFNSLICTPSYDNWSLNNLVYINTIWIYSSLFWNLQFIVGVKLFEVFNILQIIKFKWTIWIVIRNFLFNFNHILHKSFSQNF